MVSVKEINFKFDPSESEDLIKIYEHFIELLKLGRTGLSSELDDLGVFPKKEWYTEMSSLIDAYGYEKYRDHVKTTMESLITLQRAVKKLDNQIKADDRKGVRSNYSKYISDIEWDTIVLGPTHFYFYYSEKGRYLRGMILSIACIPDPILLKLIERFSIECPFQVGGHSQAPTGLYVYDALEVFSMLDYPSSIPYIMSLKAKVKQTWAQKRFDKYLKQIAKKQKIELDKIIEIGISDYGFNQDNIYEQKLDNYKIQISFPYIKEKQVFWINLTTDKKQKSVPKEIREDHPELLKYIKNHIKDIDTQLLVQSKRIEKQYYIDKEWEVNYWQEKYLEHPFIGIITKELFWLFTNEESNIVCYIDDKTVKSVNDGTAINIQNYRCVNLWHPKHQTTSSVDSIKEIVEAQKLQQPFKQVEREKYEADFIDKSKGSIMKKSILSQLCKTRGWTSSANHNIKILDLNLISELLLKDSNDDTRGKFYGSENVELKGLKMRINKNEVSFNEVNPITLSEILRDVDLFISSAKSQ